jgi:serine/threonine protein kinase/beta-lactam-binding protein with PASTA domain
VQSATEDRLVGRLLEGRYRVRAQLARGGMSTVYSALDERLDREVAVKVMSPALSADPAFADRFAQEARVAARLSHINAVAVYDQGVDGEHVFLVMELVRGRTLRDLIREYGALSPALAISVMQPVLGALAAAHRAGLVHRDVKPENILLSDDGAVKVADFGLARAIETELSSTRTGLMMGTVAYCPPEQISRGAADARSDVYSAGIVLFELLTGSPPYAGDTPMAVAYQHVHSDVPAPSSRRPGLPWPFDDIVQRATARQPSARPLDAGVFLAELHNVRVDLGLPVAAIPPRRDPRQSPDATQRLPRIAAGGPPPQPEQQPQFEHRTAAFAATEPTRGVRAEDRDHHTLVTDGRSMPGPAPQRGRGPEPARSAPQRPSPPSRPPAAEAAARRKRGRRRGLIIVIVVLLLGLATGAGAWYFVAGRYERVSNVVGQPQGLAVQALNSQGLKVDPTVRKQFSETVAAGDVISTSPGASSRVLHGRIVELVVSQGQERFTLPSVAKKTFAQAKQALTSSPVTVTESDTADDTVGKGLVIRTDPAAGTKVKRDQVITVFISTGPPVIAVPNVVGGSQAAADAALTKAGFKPSYTQDFSDTVPTGVVISQTPTGSTPAVKFSAVAVVISKGVQMVTIPQIAVGSNDDVAKSTLDGLGLDATIKKRHKSIFDFSDYAHQVVSVDPPSGTSVRIGTVVVITGQ